MVDIRLESRALFFCPFTRNLSPRDWTLSLPRFFVRSCLCAFFSVLSLAACRGQNHRRAFAAEHTLISKGGANHNLSESWAIFHPRSVSRCLTSSRAKTGQDQGNGETQRKAPVVQGFPARRHQCRRPRTARAGEICTIWRSNSHRLVESRTSSRWREKRGGEVLWLVRGALFCLGVWGLGDMEGL